MEKVSLTAQLRDVGKGFARRSRVEQRIPAVVYGKTIESKAISISAGDLDLIARKHNKLNVLVDLSVEGFDSGLALIRDYQADPFQREIRHLDFQAVSPEDKLEVEVPVVLEGLSKGVKNDGGIVEQLRRTLHIRALPDKIPNEIVVNISDLGVHESIHADDLTLSDGVEFPHNDNFTIVSIVSAVKQPDSSDEEADDAADVAKA